MLPNDIIRMILIECISDLLWYEAFDFIKNFYEAGSYLKRFLQKDRIFWKKLYGRAGLKLVEVDDYYDYYIHEKWLEYFHYPSDTYETWGGICFFDNDKDTITVFPHNFTINRNDYSRSGPYLAMKRNNMLYIYCLLFGDEHLLFNFNFNNKSFCIRDTQVGIILGVLCSNNRWKYIVLNDNNGEIDNLNILSNVRPQNIFTYGYYLNDGIYYRFDNSPLTETEYKLFMETRRDFIVQSLNDSSVSLAIFNNKIEYYNSNDGSIIENYRNGNFPIYNEDRTKIICIRKI